MITIRIVGHFGTAPAAAKTARFGPDGGTLGRGADCTLMLDDPHRHMSRRQARIDAVGGAFTITPLSPAVEVLVNGVTVAMDSAVPIRPGDHLQIGGYELAVDGVPAAGGLGGPGDPFAPPAPLAAPAVAIPEDWDPWSDAESPARGARPDLGPAGGLFDGLDGPGSTAGHAPAPATPMADDSIDRLFGLSSDLDPLAPGAPLGGAPPGEAPSGRAPPGHAPAGEAAGERRSPDGGGFGADTWGEQGSVLSSSWRLPRAADDRPAAPAAHPPDPPPALPAAPRAPAAFALPAGQATHPLAAALQAGLGLPALPAGTLDANGAPTPELMRRLGEPVGTSIGGLLPLLQARSTLKQEMRARMTVVSARDNNPLKFAPDASSALAQLLSPQTVRGFLPAQAAVQDACDDLLAHQIGFVAGLRAALQGLIERFDPARLETRLEPRAVLDSLVPGARKARLWEQFGTLYGEISREAVDDFDRVFGKAFAEAYDAQIARLDGVAAPAGAATPTSGLGPSGTPDG